MQESGYTPKQQKVLLALGEMYDKAGCLTRDEAIRACTMVGQESLAIFYALEESDVIQFQEDGELYYMPSDERIKGEQASNEM
jgi:hypothetical protein